MKKIWFSLVVVAIVGALLAGCTTSGTPAAPTAAAPSGSESTPAAGGAETGATGQTSGEACVLHIIGGARTYPGEEDAWNKVFAAFKKEYSCDVQARWQGEWSDAPKNLEAARLAKEPVDITYNSATLNSTMARSGSLMDLTELVKPYADRFAPGMLDKYTLGGKVWAVPVSDSSTSAFFYNATMFKDLGLQEPKTYADLVTISNKIRDEKGILPLIHQGKEPWYWPMWYFETFAQTSGNKSIDYTEQFLSGKRQFTSPEEIAALNDIAQFYKDNVMTQESLDTDNEGMRATFLQQKAAMFYGGTWELAPLREANPSFEIGVFQFPLVVDTSGVVSQHGGGPDNAWSIPSSIDPKNLPMAAQFLEFLTRPDNAATIISTYSPMIPSIKDVPTSDDPLAAKFNTEFMPNTITYLDWIWPNEVNDAVMQVIPAVLTGNMTAEDGAATVQQALDTVREEKNYTYDWWTTWTDADWAKVTPAQIPTIEVK